jgi:hypothetical protein
VHVVLLFFGRGDLFRRTLSVHLLSSIGPSTPLCSRRKASGTRSPHAGLVNLRQTFVRRRLEPPRRDWRSQVDDLDSARLREGIAVKPSDSRAKRFIEQYGERCWETDILPAAVIEQALDDHVRSWLDGKLRQRRTAEIERARALL